MTKPLLEIKNLKKQYPIYGPMGKMFRPKTHMNAVAGLSLEIHEKETYGLVGESGCGKSTTGRSIVKLVTPDEGEILYQGSDLLKLSNREYKPLCRDLQMIFQDSLSSMNPRQRIGQILEEPLIIHEMGDADERRRQVMEILTKVGLSEEYFFRYPHELSGGQVQRLGIARALIIKPKLIICDEPVSALDVSIQAQILNTLTSLQKEMDLSLLFISHDIGVVRYISKRIGVMYLGTLVEEADTEELFANTLHPYTKALLASVPDFSVAKKREVVLKGEQPVRTDEFRGCVFHTRCPYATEKCKTEQPELREIAPGHKAACHLCEGAGNV